MTVSVRLGFKSPWSLHSKSHIDKGVFKPWISAGLACSKGELAPMAPVVHTEPCSRNPSIHLEETVAKANAISGFMYKGCWHI